MYPAHDYKGDTVSTIGEEKAYNPRLQVKSVDEYVDLMNNLKLTNPKMMDIAVPANMKVGSRRRRSRFAAGRSRQRRRLQSSASRTSRSSIYASVRSANVMALFPAHCMCPIRPCRKTSATAACCTSS